MQLKLKALYNWKTDNHEVIEGKTYTSSFNKVDEDGVLMYLIELNDGVDEVYFPDIVFDILCPQCDGNGQEEININLTVGIEDEDFEDFEELMDEPVKIDCNFCNGKKIVTREQILKLGESKSAWCSCHHVKSSEQVFIKGSWIHMSCGRKIQDM